MPGKRTLIGSDAVSSIQSVSRGRLPSSRVLRGGAFNNQPSNVRSAYRNNNEPDNRNNNNGFRPSSTLRQASCLPSQNPQAAAGHPAERESAKFRPLSRVGRLANRPAE